MDGLRLVGAGVDSLRVTVGKLGAEKLLGETIADEPAFGSRGFKAGEQRMCLGGYCWRRWEPHQPSTRWGLDYESWEWPGECARFAWTRLPVEDCRATRIDVAFDFQCSESCRPEDVAELVAPWCRERGITPDGISGQGGVFTCYIGSKHSDRRVRIYRRDRLHEELLLDFGPLLRIELELHDGHADALLEVFSSQGTEAGNAAAAAHIRELTGLEVQLCSEVPTLPAVEDADQEQQLLQFIQQHGENVRAWHRMGVPLVQLCEAAAPTRSRMTRHRAFKRLEAWACVDWQRIADRIFRRLADLVAARTDAAA